MRGSSLPDCLHEKKVVPDCFMHRRMADKGDEFKRRITYSHASHPASQVGKEEVADAERASTLGRF
jgi:hypothetical protein